MSEVLPVPAAAGGEVAALGGCCSLRLLFAGDWLRILYWRCLADGEALACERHHATPAVSLAFAGASLVRWGRRSLQFDLTRAIVHQPDVPYATRHPWGTGCRGLTLLLDSRLEEALRPSPPGARSARPESNDFVVGPAAQLSARRLGETLLAGEPSEPLAIETWAVTLIGQLLALERSKEVTGARRADTRAVHECIVTRTCRLLQERYREPLGLRELSRAANASPDHLSRTFRRQTGVSVHQYLLRLRLHAALDEICESALDLSTLAHALGFSSHSHFTVAFRDAFGRPPSVVRRELRTLRRPAREAACATLRGALGAPALQPIGSNSSAAEFMQ